MGVRKLAATLHSWRLRAFLDWNRSSSAECCLYYSASWIRTLKNHCVLCQARACELCKCREGNSVAVEQRVGAAHCRGTGFQSTSLVTALSGGRRVSPHPHPVRRNFKDIYFPNFWNECLLQKWKHLPLPSPWDVGISLGIGMHITMHV